jgi:hypothetical protein
VEDFCGEHDEGEGKSGDVIGGLAGEAEVFEGGVEGDEGGFEEDVGQGEDDEGAIAATGREE